MATDVTVPLDSFVLQAVQWSLLIQFSMVWSPHM